MYYQRCEITSTLDGCIPPSFASVGCIPPLTSFIHVGPSCLSSVFAIVRNVGPSCLNSVDTTRCTHVGPHVTYPSNACRSSLPSFHARGLGSACRAILPQLHAYNECARLSQSLLGRGHRWENTPTAPQISGTNVRNRLEREGPSAPHSRVSSTRPLGPFMSILGAPNSI